jgi:hypothetical protein
MAAVFCASFSRRAMVCLQARHLDPLLARRIIGRGRRARGDGCGSRSRALADGVEHIALEHLAALARTRHVASLDLVFSHQLLCGRRGRHVRTCSLLRRFGGFCRLGLGRSLGLFGGLGGCCRRARFAFGDLGQQRVDLDGLAVLGENFAQHARDRAPCRFPVPPAVRRHSPHRRFSCTNLPPWLR